MTAPKGATDLRCGVSLAYALEALDSLEWLQIIAFRASVRDALVSLHDP